MKKNNNLRDQTITGFKWSFLDNVGRLGGQFIIGIILARLLDPSDFGLIGMLTIFIVIGQSLTNSGFGQALIQKKNADNVDFSTVFYFNILASIIIYLLIYAAAPLIAQFYGQPQLVLLTKVISFVFVIEAFGRIHNVFLEKRLDFKAPSIIGVLSVLISGIVSIIMAYRGFGVWALVVNTLLKGIITTILLWLVSKWRPLFSFSLKALKTMFSFGSKILVAGLVQSVFQNLYYIVIGRIFSAQSLGYYTKAHQFADLPVKTITLVVQKVTFPVFSTIQDDEEKITSGYIKVIRVLSMASLPLMAIIFISAHPLVNIVLGSKWLPMVPYLKVMSLYGWIYVLYTMNNQIITVRGRSDYYLHIQIIDKLLIVISILITYKYGILVMIYGHMVATILTYLIGSIYLKKIVNISLYLQTKNIAPFLVAAFFMLLASIPLSLTISTDYIYLLSSVFAGIGIYIFILWLFKVEELTTGMTLAINFLKRGKVDQK
jgi:teichuronic acid exporter